MTDSYSGKKFSEFGLTPDVERALDRLELTNATPIQEKVIEPILAGRDVAGKAETGTGKTIGFCAPMVGRLDTQRVSVQAIVLAPTRELAQQVAGVFSELGSERDLGVALIVGGVHASEQIEKLRSGTQVVVGTPGRVLEFLRDRILSLAWCDTVVLDEADRMLDMGFIEDVSAILDATPGERQTLLFSATLPQEVQGLLDRYMRDPMVISTTSGISTVPEIEQKYIETTARDKFRELRRILDEHADDTAIVFTNTRRQTIDLDRLMWGHGYSAACLHGDQDQEARFRILEAFRKGDIRILIATDVASRGLDIEAVGWVINFEVPDEAESYVHRIGRTGRAKQAGRALTLVAPKEWRQWQEICRTDGLKIERQGPQRIQRHDDDSSRRAAPSGPGQGGAGRSQTSRRRSRSGGRAERSRSGGRAERSRDAGRAERSRDAGRAERSRDAGVAVAKKNSPRQDKETPTEGTPVSGRPRGRRRRRGSSERETQPSSEVKVKDGGSAAPTKGRGRRREPAPKVEFTSEERELMKKKERERPDKRKLDTVLQDDFIKDDYFGVGAEPQTTSTSTHAPRRNKKPQGAATEKNQTSPPEGARRRRRKKKGSKK